MTILGMMRLPLAGVCQMLLGIQRTSTLSPKFAPMIVVGLMTYLVSFQSGLGPIPWIVNSEIYPLWFRSVGVSLSTGFNWALNIMVSYTFLLLVQAMDFGTYYFCAGWSALAIFWFFIVLPETKGKSLEEMDQLFSKPLWRMGRG